MKWQMAGSDPARLLCPGSFVFSAGWLDCRLNQNWRVSIHAASAE